MAEPYLTDLRELVAVADCLRPYDISCRHFFSGAAAYCGENIIMTLTPIGLAIKLSVEDRAAAFAAGWSELRYFEKSPVKKDYAVAPGGLDPSGQEYWISRSLAGLTEIT
jgi:hypothetical protein